MPQRLLIVSGALVRRHENNLYVQGGFGRHVDAFARYFEHVYLFTCVENVGFPLDDYCLQAQNVFLIPLRHFQHPSKPIRFALMARASLEAAVKLPGAIRQCDVLHPRLPSPVGNVGAFLARYASRPTFVYLAGDWQSAILSKGQTLVVRTLAAAVHGTLRFLVGEHLCFTAGEPLARKFGGPCNRVIPIMTTAIDRTHVVSPEAACKRTERQLREILFVGRVWQGKGVHILLEAVRELRVFGLDARLKIIGKPVGGDGWLRRYIVTLGLQDVVTHHPHMAWDRLISEYEMSDVFVLPSIEERGEGVPKVVLEAMARGVPVVASDVGGVSSLVKHGENGLLVSPGSPMAIVQAIRTLEANVDLRKKLVTNGIQTATQYDLDSLIGFMVAKVRELPGLN